MNNVLRVSEAVGIGLHTMGLLASDPGAVMTTAHVARLFDVSEAHLSKVLQRLGRAGLLRSVRGPKGGVRLGRPASRIRLIDIHLAIDGPLPQCACVLGHARCPARKCLLGPLAGQVARQVRDYFSRTRLSDLAPAFARLGAAR